MGEAVELGPGAEIRGVDLSGAHVENVVLRGARLKEVVLSGARISGLIDGLTVNDVEVGPLIAAELDRRHPERVSLRATDAAGVRAAMALLDAQWRELVNVLRSLPESRLHERTSDGDWSALENLRHLVFVTDAWITGVALGRADDASRFHPWGVAPGFIPDPSAMGIDVDADPSLDEVIDMRLGRLEQLRDLVSSVTDAQLSERRGDHTVLHCLRVAFDEEWAHTWYIRRDLGLLA